MVEILTWAGEFYRRPFQEQCTSLRRGVENGLDYIGKYNFPIPLGSVTGALRAGVALVALVVSTAVLFYTRDSKNGWKAVQFWAIRHSIIGLLEIPPGLKWFLMDFFGFDLTSNPTLTDLSQWDSDATECLRRRFGYNAFPKYDQQRLEAEKIWNRARDAYHSANDLWQKSKQSAPEEEKLDVYNKALLDAYEAKLAYTEAKTAFQKLAAPDAAGRALVAEAVVSLEGSLKWAEDLKVEMGRRYTMTANRIAAAKRAR